MDDIIIALARLRRPPIIIFAISAFAILAGITFITRPEIPHGPGFQDLIGIVLMVSGFLGLGLIGIPRHNRTAARLGLAAAGSLITVGFTFRGLTLWYSLIRHDLGDAWSFYLIGGAQWTALAYMTMVAWFDVALPWVLARTR